MDITDYDQIEISDVPFSAHYSGRDVPNGINVRGTWRSKVEVVDTCRNNVTVAGPDNVTVDWFTT